jgi:NTE family protein
MTLARWLDANLFRGATFADLRKTPGPLIWINASDIYNRTPFIFGETAFISLCSDLRSYPLADAVAASAAVPIVFTPMVVKAFPRSCTDQPPDWLLRARANPNTPPLLKSYAEGLYSYFDGTTKYVKLLDGGLVDNYGLSGFTIARLQASKPYEHSRQRRPCRCVARSWCWWTPASRHRAIGCRPWTGRAAPNW